MGIGYKPHTKVPIGIGSGLVGAPQCGERHLHHISGYISHTKSGTGIDTQFMEGPILTTSYEVSHTKVDIGIEKQLLREPLSGKSYLHHIMGMCDRTSKFLLFYIWIILLPSSALN